LQRFLDQFFRNGAQNAMIIAVADFHPSANGLSRSQNQSACPSYPAG
jgi:hypothetical protein